MAKYLYCHESIIAEHVEENLYWVINGHWHGRFVDGRFYICDNDTDFNPDAYSEPAIVFDEKLEDEGLWEAGARHWQQTLPTILDVRAGLQAVKKRNSTETFDDAMNGLFD